MLSTCQNLIDVTCDNANWSWSFVGIDFTNLIGVKMSIVNKDNNCESGVAK